MIYPKYESSGSDEFSEKTDEFLVQMFGINANELFQLLQLITHRSFMLKFQMIGIIQM